MGPNQFCVDRAKVLLEFAEQIWKLKFSEKPPYDKLQHLLLKPLLRKKKVPNIIMDWSKFKTTKN